MVAVAGLAEGHLERLREALHSDDEERRRGAVQQLPGAGANPLALAVGALGDASWRVRKEAALRLGAWDEPERAAQALANALLGGGAFSADGHDIGRRNAAVEALGRLGTPAVAALSDLLRQADASVRKLVAEALGEGAASDAQRVLHGLLHDEDANVAAAAAEALGRLGAGAQELLALLPTSPESAGRPGSELLWLGALGALARLRVRVPLDRLTALAAQPILRPTALLAMGASGDPAATATLVAALTERAPFAHAAALALARLLEADPRAVLPRAGTLDDALLLRLLTSPDPAVSAIATLVQYLGGPGLVAPLADALLEEVAAGGGPGPAARALSGLLSGPGRALAAAALAALPAAQKASGQRALLGLLAPLSEEGPADAALAPLLPLARAGVHGDDPALALAAVWLLGSVGEVGDVSILIDQLERGGAVGQAALQALQALAQRGAREPLRERLARLDPLTYAEGALLCALLGAVGGPAEAQRLLGVLQAESSRLRRAALLALGRLGHTAARGALVFALTDEVPEVRAAAARALGELGPVAAGEGPSLLAPLLSATADPFPQVRLHAIRALVKIGDPGAVTPLRERVISPDGLTARTALEALATLGALDADTLELALDHIDPEVLKVALRLLSEQGPARRREERESPRSGPVDDQGAAVRPLLLQALSDERWDVRIAAAQATARALGAAGRTALEQALGGEADPLVREALLAALTGLPAPAPGGEAAR